MRALVALRERLFARINGPQGIPVPGPLVGAEHFERVYADPAANGRSRGAGLSDLFWYWLAPGPHMHQEHLEPGERYTTVARTTRRVLAVPHRRSDELATAAARRTLDRLPAGRSSLVRLRDLVMPLWAEVYYELVFAEPCPNLASMIESGAVKPPIGKVYEFEDFGQALIDMDERRTLGKSVVRVKD